MSIDVSVDSRLHHQLVQTIQRECEQPWRHDLVRCAPMLIQLMQQMGEAPSSHLSHAVRAAIAEHCLIDEGGDATVYDLAGIDRTAEVLARRLMELRESHQLVAALEVPPQTFG